MLCADASNRDSQAVGTPIGQPFDGALVAFSSADNELPPGEVHILYVQATKLKQAPEVGARCGESPSLPDT